MRSRLSGRHRARALCGSLVAAMLWGSAAAVAQEQVPPSPPTVLPSVLVTAPLLSTSSSEQLIPGKDFELRPEGRPDDIWTTRYRWRDLEAFLSVENLTNARWRESQFFFTSRLPGEPAAGVSGIHFTPGNPRSFLGGIAIHF
jgi:hypothetical protein